MVSSCLPSGLPKKAVQSQLFVLGPGVPSTRSTTCVFVKIILLLILNKELLFYVIIKIIIIVKKYIMFYLSINKSLCIKR